MEKIVRTLLAVIMTCILLPHVVLPAQAAEEKFVYELSVDGRDTKEVENGDIITVVLRLKRTDQTEDYTMYAMQDEIRYDSQFLEMVEGSAVLRDGIVSTKIVMVDQFQEFYMNYLSMSGGESWNTDVIIGSFQLKVVGERGVTKITNEDYSVSFKDGSASYPCIANELTIILSTDCVVTFQTNGGNNLDDIVVQMGEKIQPPERVIREGYQLQGWYKDIHLTETWDFDEDTVEGNMSLYAKWIAEEPIVDVENDDNWMWLVYISALLIILIILARWRRKNRIYKYHKNWREKND